MNRIKLSKNVNITTISNDKFKRNRISIVFLLPNEKEKSTMYSLMTGVLERAYEEYPTMKEFSKKLNKMYNAAFDVSTSTIGQNRILRFTMQGIKNEYCLENEDLLNEISKTMLGVIFSPCLEDNGFIKEWVEIEKFKLREEIESEINDKRGYCVKNARRKFFKGSLNGVERLGYLEDLEKIDEKGLYECYSQLLNTASVEIFVTANESDSVAKSMKKGFEKERNDIKSMLPIEIMPTTDLEIYNEDLDTTQGKVCLIYTTNRKLTEKDRYSMLVAASLYGGTASSRLFKNVREKQSLCYYCVSSFNWFTSSMTVDSGVEHENIQKVIDATKAELDMLINGDISDDEINEIKLTIKNGLVTNYDSLHGLEAWYLNEILRNSNNTPEEVIDLVSKVSKEDVKEILKTLHLNVIYTISKSE